MAQLPQPNSQRATIACDQAAGSTLAHSYHVVSWASHWRRPDSHRGLDFYPVQDSRPRTRGTPNTQRTDPMKDVAELIREKRIVILTPSVDPACNERRPSDSQDSTATGVRGGPWNVEACGIWLRRCGFGDCLMRNVPKLIWSNYRLKWNVLRSCCARFV